MIITVDTGGTKMLVAGFSIDGQITSSKQFPTPQNSDDYITKLKTALWHEFGGDSVDALLIAIPGIIENDIVVRAPDHLSWLRGLDIKRELVGMFHGAPIIIKNDALLGGIGAVNFLPTVPPLALYLAIGTGIGSSVLINGQIDSAVNKSEAGHSVLEFDGCLQKWEHFASGKAIFDLYGQLNEATPAVVWNDVANRLGRGLLAIIPVLQPDIILFSGSIGAMFGKYKDGVSSILAENLSPVSPKPDLIQAAHTDKIVVYGGYIYAKNLLAQPGRE